MIEIVERQTVETDHRCVVEDLAVAVQTQREAAGDGLFRRLQLGFARTDEIVAWLYVGTVEGARREPVPVDPAQFVREWPAGPRS